MADIHRAARGHAEVTFQPGDTALLVLDGTRRYQILLATGAVTPQAAD